MKDRIRRAARVRKHKARAKERALRRAEALAEGIVRAGEPERMKFKLESGSRNVISLSTIAKQAFGKALFAQIGKRPSLLDLLAGEPYMQDRHG